jgi:hypothetical protein
MRLGHPFIGVGGRQRRSGRAGDDGKCRPFNGAVIGVKEGEEMQLSKGG